MAKPEQTRITTKRLKKAGFTRTDAEGSHGKWTHPSGASVIVPDGHKVTSAGVVRQVDKAIAESKEAK
jgi:predicted RNA binding protein YcfA (HicA-like mRNA interferase family)